ncbi:uncharacterized protein M437DRAFT_59017 [Aureobasidium melanogenum CBS 110374]|uniref:Uncharacterized protein n=1 Tax=Aureobasidium melanogenum (strain CBS 110374) TaxID=1043003 RepID=A0A074VLF5_AURM1|nr:uncharacterized protein M437DRAFT_59017 [Aureobasidium melanogenum CBS 110374]KEQ58492.1 hypothetical protein M437DRAFT_59017 [Aureobasidium melanogenum CBS 110374]
MSWMDSWSRPKKNAATPPPLYLTSSEVRYCHVCGRVIGSRKSNTAKSAATEVKFCSDRCKRHKLRSVDKRIEAAFAALLDGQDASQFAAKQQKVKGDPRILVSCSEVETLIFGSREDPEKTFGRKKNRARRGFADDDVWKSVDMVDSDTDTGTAETVSADEDTTETGGGDTDADVVKLKGRVRPPQSESEVNGSIGGEKGWAERIHETPEMLQKRREGQRRAEEKEMVKCAARRAVVFGLESSRQEGKRMCEAVMHGAVVEPSYAKGDWFIRWREE